MIVPSFYTHYSKCLKVQFANKDTSLTSFTFHWSEINIIKQWMWIYDYPFEDMKKVVSLHLELMVTHHKFNIKKCFMWDIQEEIAKVGHHLFHED